MEEKLFEFDWQLDEAAAQERGVIYEEYLSGRFLQENRVALMAGTLARHPENQGWQLLDIPLRCVVTPHPVSEFDWFQLIVDFAAHQEVSIKDLVPQKVKGDVPVKLTTKYVAGVGLEVSTIKLGPTISRETTQETTVYFSKIDGTGIDSTRAIWNFYAAPGEELTFDGELHILLAVPAALQTLQVAFTAHGVVRRKGLAGKIPLLARRSFTFNSLRDLT